MATAIIFTNPAVNTPSKSKTKALELVAKSFQSQFLKMFHSLTVITNSAHHSTVFDVDFELFL